MLALNKRLSSVNQIKNDMKKRKKNGRIYLFIIQSVYIIMNIAVKKNPTKS